MKQNNFCEKCGQAININDKFCDACGFDLVKGTNTGESIGSKRKLKLPFSLSSIILVVILINAYFLIEKYYNLKDNLEFQKKINAKLEKKLDEL